MLEAMQLFFFTQNVRFLSLDQTRSPEKWFFASYWFSLPWKTHFSWNYKCRFGVLLWGGFQSALNTFPVNRSVYRVSAALKTWMCLTNHVCAPEKCSILSAQLKCMCVVCLSVCQSVSRQSFGHFWSFWLSLVFSPSSFHLVLAGSERMTVTRGPGLELCFTLHPRDWIALVDSGIDPHASVAGEL